MSGRALIVERDGGFAVKAPVKLRPSTRVVVGAMSVHYFPTLDAARGFCLCCGYVVTLAVPTLELKPPRGRA